jgi:hypothetical protein
MSYITRRLAGGEEIIAEGRYHWFQKTWPWLALLFLGIIGIGIIIWAVALMRMATTKWAVTNRRVLLKRGFWTVHVGELTLPSIEGAEVDQSIFGRIFGFGKLKLKGRVRRFWISRAWRIPTASAPRSRMRGCAPRFSP